MNAAMAASSNNIAHRRCHSEVAINNSADKARRRGEELLTQDVHKMKTSKSFHGSITSTTVKSRRRPTRSFNSEDISMRAANRYCDVHPEVTLQGEDQCPECAIQLMKLAAKTLERRAAQLELERKEKEMEEVAKKQRRKERKLVSSSESSEERVAGRQKEINSLLRWSTGYEHVGKSRNAAASKSKRDDKVVPPRPPLRRQRSIGEIAHKGEVDDSLSRAETLIRIARLREGDGVWVRRSHDMWTYATLKAREDGPDACLVFTVNGRGATKKFPVTHWAKFIRIVANSSSEEEEELQKEEDEIDAMLEVSDVQLDNESSPSRRSMARAVDDDEFSQSDQVLCRSSRSGKKELDDDEFSQSDHDVLCGSNRRAKERKSKSKHEDGKQMSGGNAERKLRSSYPQPAESKAKTGRGLRSSHSQLKGSGTKNRRGEQESIDERPSSAAKARKGEAKTGKDGYESNQRVRDKSKAKSAKSRPLAKVSEEHELEKSLDTFSSCPSTESDVYEPMEERAGSVDLQDHNVSMYTFSDKFVNETHSQTDSSEAESSVQDHEVSMYTFWGDQHDVLEEEVESCATDDEREGYLPPTNHQQHVGQSSNPPEPILRRRPTPEDQKSKLNVSFALPEQSTRGDGPPSSKLSMTTTSEHSSSANYDADADADADDAEGKGQKSDEFVGDLGKVNEILQRSSSLPIAEVPHERAPSKPRRQSSFRRDRHSNRGSWTVGMEIGEEIRVEEQRRASLDSMDGGAASIITKKKLKELDMGKSIPKHLGKVKQRSFHSALKSIHKRSSIMMPPSTNAAVNLN